MKHKVFIEFIMANSIELSTLYSLYTCSNFCFEGNPNTTVTITKSIKNSISKTMIILFQQLILTKFEQIEDIIKYLN